MKTLILVFTFNTIFTPGFAQVSMKAEDIMSAAFSRAKKENKNVFVKFSASWCGWCRVLEKSMKDSICKDYFENNFVIVTMIIEESSENKKLENPGADSLILKLSGQKIKGIPYWIILDTMGTLLADGYYNDIDSLTNVRRRQIGCPATEKEVASFIYSLSKTTKLSELELDLIRARFRRNEIKKR